MLTIAATLIVAIRPYGIQAFVDVETGLEDRRCLLEDLERSEMQTPPRLMIV